MAVGREVGGERVGARRLHAHAKEYSGSLFMRTLILLDQSPTIMLSFKLNDFHKDPISKYCHIGVRASMYKLEGGRGEGHCLVHSIYFSSSHCR